MKTKKKSAGEGNPQSGYIRTHTANDMSISIHIKALIVRLAIWGLLPIRPAECLIRRLTGGRP